MRTDLNRTITRIVDNNLCCIPTFVVFDRLCTQNLSSDSHMLFRSKPGTMGACFGVPALFISAIILLFNRLMNTYQTATIGKNRLYLNQRDHVGHSLHHIIFGQYFCGIGHHLFQGFSFASSFQSCRTDVGYSFRIIQLQPFSLRRAAIAPNDNNISLSISFGVKCIVFRFKC